MTIQAHLATLQKRHDALERDIETAMAQPGSSDLKITELKRKKLALKQEMERLRHQNGTPPTVH
jgi:hypothetical protein